MCCHLVSYSASCLASCMDLKPMETSASLDSERSKYCCAFRNKTGWNFNQPTYHLHIMLHILFIKCISSTHEWLIIFTKSIPSTRQSSPPLTLSSHNRVYIPGQCNTPKALKPHKCFLFSQQKLYVSFIRFLPEWLCVKNGSLGFGKKRPDSCQKLLVVEKQWHALCDSHCFANPRRPPCCNPLFLLFVRSQLLPPIGCVSFGPGTLRRPDQYGRASCQKGLGRKEEGLRKKSLIAARIRTDWENLFEESVGDRTEEKWKVALWSSRLSCTSTFDLCGRCSSLGLAHPGTTVEKWEPLQKVWVCAFVAAGREVVVYAGGSHE